jgi:hypothetical protein
VLQLNNLKLRGIINSGSFIIAEDKDITFTAHIAENWKFCPLFSTFFDGDKTNASVVAAPDGKSVEFKYSAKKGYAINLSELEIVRINCTPAKLPQ